MKTKHSRDGHSLSYLPWLARVDALIGEPARWDLEALAPRRKKTRVSGDATLATLADALEAIGVNGCRPGRAADGRRRLSSFRKRVSYSAMIGRNPLVPRRCYGRSNSAMRGLVTGPSRAYGVRGSCALNSASTS